MHLAALVGRAALALGDALEALLLSGAGARVALALPGGDGGGAPIGEPDGDEGYVEDDEDDDDDDEEEEEDPVRVD